MPECNNVVVLSLNFIQKKYPVIRQSSIKTQTYIERKKTKNYWTNNTTKLFIQEFLFAGVFQDKHNNVVMTKNSCFLQWK